MKQVICPSGLAGTVRKLKASEANLLADRTKNRATVMDSILEACWLETSDFGPYMGSNGALVGGVDKAGKIDWKSILGCDRFYALVAVRIATYGSSFYFPVLCGEGGTRGCGEQFEWEIDLEKEVAVLDLPESTRQRIAEGKNTFETETSEGQKVTFRLMTGLLERSAAKRARENRDKPITIGLISRIIKVDGANSIEKWVNNLDFDVQLDLIKKMDEHDGGFETNIEVICPECGRQQEITLPFEGRHFWIPQPRQKKNESLSNVSSPERKKRTMSTTSTNDESTPEATET